MDQPKIAQKSPYMTELEAGKTYYWCTCGGSAKQPFCDGSHKTTRFTPLAYTATKSGPAALCGCKHTKTQPMCDGSHKTLL
jgi:CDGSH iron-sulfur domain-containing protein 3